MSLNSHRRYQKAHHIEANHERGCLFEHILVPTLPEFYQNFKTSWASYANRLPLAAKVHKTVCLSLAMYIFAGDGHK